jgi:HAD superfamily hydrolase (TIGR01484 family)
LRYHALACDYDGTLATGGRVSEESVQALERLKATGRKLILVTGRDFSDLLTVFPQLPLFDRVVAENGALLYRPATREKKLLGERPPEEFIRVLRERGVPFSAGEVIVATAKPHETTVVEVIRDLGLELHLIFNIDAVMVLPSGINKATGLTEALAELGLSLHNAVGAGDAENDHAFLSACECAVAVGNALPMLQKRADIVTQAPNGSGIRELIDRMAATDLQDVDPVLERHRLDLGAREDGRLVRLAPYGKSLLICGASGSGKSTLAKAFLERLMEAKYQFCLIDPEGDYDEVEDAVALGDSQRMPSVDQVLKVLEKVDENAVVNLLALPLADRPRFFEALFPRLQEMRLRTGRPHWIVIDETHHLVPATWNGGPQMLPQHLQGLVLVTVHPDQVARAVLSAVDMAVAVGESAGDMIRAFGRSLGREPVLPPLAPGPGQLLVWDRRSGEAPFFFRGLQPRAQHRRHVRKYAAGDLGPDRSFYFRGPDGKLNLKAQNLLTFLELAEGVDEETWLFHLRRRDFSRWMQECIKDKGLAEAVAEIEQGSNGSAEESRAQVRAAIEQRYTAPA